VGTSNVGEYFSRVDATNTDPLLTYGFIGRVVTGVTNARTGRYLHCVSASRRVFRMRFVSHRMTASRGNRHSAQSGEPGDFLVSGGHAFSAPHVLPAAQKPVDEQSTSAALQAGCRRRPTRVAKASVQDLQLA
jgi:hypothetical protein